MASRGPARSGPARIGRPRKPRTILELGAEVFGEFAPRERLAADGLERYRPDPVLYAKERLGVELQPWQCAIAFAFAGRWERITSEMKELSQLENPGCRQIAVTAGQKTGKSLTVVCLALWFFECFLFSKALLTAAIASQIRAVLWTELERVVLMAPHRPLGNLSTDPARGFLSPDRMRMILGFTGRSIEALGGMSGNLAYLIDEASALLEDKSQAIKGNRSGREAGEAIPEGYLDAPMLLTSNPLQPTGPFFDAFHESRDLWTRMTLDAEVLAKWLKKKGRRVIGMHTLQSIADERKEFGEDSVFFEARVRGRFPRAETGRINPYGVITEATRRWADAPAEGVLTIGYDPAGDGGEGDAHGFAAVRGQRCLEVDEVRGLSVDAGISRVLGMLRLLRRSDEMPRVLVDAEGIGTKHFRNLRAEAEERRVKSPASAFEVYQVRASSKDVRDRRMFLYVRDELYFNLAQWLREGGAIPSHARLESELLTPMWIPRPDGKYHAMPKEVIRKLLKRSPNLADALMLAVWNPRTYYADETSGAPAPPPARDFHDANDVFYGAPETFGESAGAEDPFWPKG